MNIHGTPLIVFATLLAKNTHVDVSNGKTDHLQGSVYGFRDLIDHLILEKKMLCYKRLNHRRLDTLETSTDPSDILNE